MSVYSAVLSLLCKRSIHLKPTDGGDDNVASSNESKEG